MKHSNTSYNQLLKATSILGSSRIISLVLGFARVKILAILLGTLGVGLIGTFQAIVDMITTFCGLGMSTGAVRKIGEKEGDDKYKMVAIFKKWFFITACLGTVICLILAYPISQHYFANGQYTIPIILLSACVFFTLIASGRIAILQGLRHIAFIAKAHILESVLSLISMVVIYYYFGIKGIVPAFLVNSIIIFLCINYYYKKTNLPKVSVTQEEVKEEGTTALKLGLYIILAGCINTLSMLLVRYIAKEYAGHNDALGLFQSVWTITNAFVGFIIASAGTDYFTRLCSVNKDKNAVRKLINEQSYIILIICCPIIIGVILFANYILQIQFSSDFLGASNMLKWQMLGIFLKFAATPIASILLAKNKGLIYLISEFVFFATYITSSYLLSLYYGVTGLGMAYLISYIVYLLLIYILGIKLSDYHWNKSVSYLVLVYTTLILLAFYLSNYHTNYTLLVASLLFLISIVYSFYKLSQIFSWQQLIDWFKKK